jgi:DDE superfamily endonuclease
VAKVMHTEPYASAARVFWIVDNGSSHAGATSIQRMRSTWPTCQLVHLPVHASWLNQIEIVFSILARKVLKPADFADLDALAARLEAFAPRFNATATPFDWRFGRAQLANLCRRLDAHRPAGAHPLAA